MGCLYNFIINLYHAGILIAGLFNKKALLWVSGRKELFNNIKTAVEPNQKTAWFHCASLGEFEQGRPVIEFFRSKYPDYKILLTFFSPSGYEIRKNYEYADYIFYLPVDTRARAVKFIELINPAIVFFIKYEFWFNYLNVLHKKNIPTFVISAIFRPNQHFFKWYGSWFRKQLKDITYFFVQNEQSINLLKTIGITNASVSGDTRFDRVTAIAEQRKSFPLIELFRQDAMLLVAGSSWQPDEDILAALINNNNPKLKFLIAPHEIHSGHIDEIINKLTGNIIRFSEATEQNIINADVLIIDSIGILSHLYQYAAITYIGGGFGKGIHNILEAATFGTPVLFGPKYDKFQEAKDLIKQGGAFCVANKQQFIEKIHELLTHEDLLKRSSAICRNYVNNKKGATGYILNKIEEFKNL